MSFQKSIILNILTKLNIDTNSGDFEISPFIDKEDGSEYAVWKVSCDGNTFVLKKAKQYEEQIYSAYFCDITSGAPRIYGKCEYNGNTFLLMELVEGEPIFRFDKNKVISSIDTLVEIQNRFYCAKESCDFSYSFEKSLISRKSRGNYLNDKLLEEVYSRYIDLYCTMPRTLCHDDLLPFNILTSENSATIIDWEIAGILPYLTSFARLIAHTEDSDDAFFYMSQSDKEFAIEYYFDRFVSKRNVPYTDFRKDLDLFLFYEYCEWVMLGIKYGDTESQRYKSYLTRAKDLAGKIHGN